jgi:hypothetical protein
MKNLLETPCGLALPETAASQPFELTGKFLLTSEGLLALELGGVALAEPESDDEVEEEEDGCCGSYRKGPEHMCPDCPKRGGGFIVAIEQALAKR